MTVRIDHPLRETSAQLYSTNSNPTVDNIGDHRTLTPTALLYWQRAIAPPWVRCNCIDSPLLTNCGQQSLYH